MVNLSGIISTLIFLWPLIITNPVTSVKEGPISLQFSAISGPPIDTLVNYCTLIRAAFFYGDKSTEKNPVLADADVKYFNDNWRQVFSIESYQSGITAYEFTRDMKFREGNHAPFPPAVLYDPKNPDTYILFHLAKEVGKIKSKAYETCPACVQESIDKINKMLEGTTIQSQVSQIWFGTSTLKKITSVQEITDFWHFLRCLTIDDKVNPKLQLYFFSLPPVLRCPDTTVIKCKDEIKPKVIVGYRHCEIGGKVDTIGPTRIKGIDNCPGTVYRYKFVARDFCFKKDSAYQYFIIKNDDPSATCASDTTVDCIENLVIRKPQSFSSCSLKVKVVTKGPKLVSGHYNCPDAKYEMEYTVKDTCGREIKCIQKIYIDNDPPTIECPPDTVVECSKYIKKRNVKYTVSCHKHGELTVDGPTLIKGKPDCDGSVYEMIYTVKDSCDRKASCTRKFTIKNKGPEIICPPNEEVLCFDDIRVGTPKEIKVYCDLGYDVKITDPVLIIGKKNCAGSVYQVIYTVTDACGRSDECEQLFTILNDDIKIDCPPDQTVKCSKDIKASTAIVKVACKLDFKVTTSAPKLVSGKENCPGAKYQIIYHVEDACGRTKDCIQTFTIDNLPPEIVCYPDMTVECDKDPDFQPPVPVVSCDLKYDLSYTDPVLVSGKDDCDGAVYKVTYTVTDECGRTAECTQKFTLHIPLPEIECPKNAVVKCENEIVAGNPVVKVYCEQTYDLNHTGPVLVKGKRDCPGAEYTITYTVTDDCMRSISCTQHFTIDNGDPVIVCPPDRIVECEDDIKEEEVQASSSCGHDDVLFDGPELESGKPGCPNAVYVITYSIIDSCGRRAECKQRFRLSGDDLQVKCPNDTTVQSKADIVPSPVYATTSCDVEAFVTSTEPQLISGTDDQPGAVYKIIYTIVDDCDQRETCIQRFTIIGIADGCLELCDCHKEYKNVPSDLVMTDSDRFNKDLAALIKKYGCKKLKEWAQKGAVELWNAWSASEILGNETGIAAEIARRGDINGVMQNLDKINKAIEILEEAINGDPKKTMQIISEWGLTEGITYLTGSGTPALVYGAIKSLGEFAEYLNKEILILNLKTLSNYADGDPCFFDPGHYLLKYAKIREIKPGDKITWNDLRNPFRTAIYDYATHRLQNPNLPPPSEIWKSQQQMNLLRTVTHSMLKEICQFWCYKMTLKTSLNKLKQEQSLLLRFKAILQYINTHDCNGNENPCTMDHAELVDVNGNLECHCVNGYKWDPGKIRCIPYSDCSGIANSVEVYRGDYYECDCPEGYEWNADKSGCVLKEPDCPSYYPHSYAVFNQQMNRYECYCIEGYEWNADRTECVPVKPDCASFYPNTTAIWNAQENRYECNCIEGYIWNASRTGCDPAPPDCPSFYPNTVAVWNAQTNQYECNCVQGYVWNATRTGCELPAPDCPSYYPNTVAVWNAQTNQYECNCIQGYVWNATKTGCELPVPDCNSYYPNTVASWNAQTNQYECNCIQGYVWNATRTGCIPSAPDCNSYYPNTVASWNAQTNQYECNCIQGYVWNATRTGCIPSAPDCNAYYPNTVATWNAQTNQYECNCIQGYVWNATRTGCVASGPDCNAYYPNTVAVWNAQTNQYECNCAQGYEWNATRTGCVLSTDRSNPPVNPTQQKTGECNISYKSGANEPEQYTIDVHAVTGTLDFTYNTYTVKDRIHIYYGNGKIFDSGCVGQTGGQSFTLDGYNSVFRIVVDPLCEPNVTDDTEWDFTLGCPH